VVLVVVVRGGGGNPGKISRGSYETGEGAGGDFLRVWGKGGLVGMRFNDCIIKYNKWE
jgi:hypothetical protein